MFRNDERHERQEDRAERFPIAKCVEKKKLSVNLKALKLKYSFSFLSLAALRSRLCQVNLLSRGERADLHMPMRNADKRPIYSVYTPFSPARLRRSAGALNGRRLSLSGRMQTRICNFCIEARIAATNCVPRRRFIFILDNNRRAENVPDAFGGRSVGASA